MFYFSLLVFLVCGWILPWWCAAVAALILGIALPGKFSRALQVCAAAGLAWAVLGYILDGRSHGLISQRMSAMFGLPAPALMFVPMAVLGALTALLSYQSGTALRNCFRS